MLMIHFYCCHQFYCRFKADHDHIHMVFYTTVNKFKGNKQMADGDCELDVEPTTDKIQ